jgi:hypothetical protein
VEYLKLNIFLFNFIKTLSCSTALDNRRWWIFFSFFLGFFCFHRFPVLIMYFSPLPLNSFLVSLYEFLLATLIWSLSFMPFIWNLGQYHQNIYKQNCSLVWISMPYLKVLKKYWYQNKPKVKVCYRWRRGDVLMWKHFDIISELHACYHFAWKGEKVTFIDMLMWIFSSVYGQF